MPKVTRLGIPRKAAFFPMLMLKCTNLSQCESDVVRAVGNRALLLHLSIAFRACPAFYPALFCNLGPRPASC